MKDMSKKNLIEICKEQTNYTIATSRATLDLFCEIMGYPKSNANYFIADDPHGIVDIMEGYRIFNMSDIHTVISEYEHWMEIYKTNEELRKAVDAWYYYSTEWHEKHPPIQWSDSSKVLPQEGDTVYLYRRTTCCNDRASDSVTYSQLCIYSKEEFATEEKKIGPTTIKIEVPYWMNYVEPDGTYCPNIRSWLAGCPVEGLREATPEYIEEQRKAQETAHRRVEECKQALYQAMEEEVKLNKF